MNHERESLIVGGTLLVILISATGLGYLAHRSPLAFIEHEQGLQRGDIDTRPISDIRLTDFDLGPRPSVRYFTRPQFHDKVCEALEQAHSNFDSGQIGVLLLGPPMVGKTRLAIASLQGTLGKWRLLTWKPSFNKLPVETFSRFQGRRVAIFVDNLQDYARLDAATDVIERIDKLRNVCDALILVATSRDGRDENLTKGEFEPLLSRLATFRLAPMQRNGQEAQAFFEYMEHAHVELHRESFDGTPGSALLDLEPRTTLLRTSMPPEPLAILKALALLRAAYIFTYPEARVQRVVAHVFGQCQSRVDWQAASNLLVTEGWLRRNDVGVDGLGYLAPPTDAYLDVCVDAVYRHIDRPIEHDFPQLMEALSITPRDADALFSLSAAFRLSEPLKALPLGSIATLGESALTCAERGLDQLDPAQGPLVGELWARGESTLGLAYFSRIEGTRLLNLRHAFDAFSRALEVRAKHEFPVSWADTVYNRALVREALVVLLTDNRDPESCQQREAALAELREVLEIFQGEYPEKYEDAIDLYSAVKALNCER